MPSATWPRAAAWAAISIAIFVRWRTAAALGAWSAVLYEVFVVARRINADQGYDVSLGLLVWPLLLAVAAAVLLSVPAPVGRGLDLLGRRGRWLLAVAAAVTMLTATLIPLLGEYNGRPEADSIDPGFQAVFVVSSRLGGAVGGMTFAIVLALALATIMSADRAVRSRVLTLTGAGAAGIVTIHLGLPRPFGVWEMPVVSRPTEAALLLIGPGLVLGTGLLLVRSGIAATDEL